MTFFLYSRHFEQSGLYSIKSQSSIYEAYSYAIPKKKTEKLGNLFSVSRKMPQGELSHSWQLVE